MSKKMKARLVWEDPPATEPPDPKDWDRELAPVKARQGVWARIITGYPTAIHAIARHLRETLPSGEWEIEVHPVSQVNSGLWVRYVG